VRSGITGNPHPRQIVETRSLAGASAPDLTYKPAESVVSAHKRGVLSDEQYDAIIAVRQGQENGHAVLVADDVGVGKSREIAGVHADLHSKLAKGGRVLITTVSEANLYDLERELRIFHGVDEENGQLPFQVVRLRDFKESSERPGQKREYKPIPVFDNAVYLVEAHNLTPYTRAILDLNIEAVLADEAHKYKNEDASVGMTWKALHRHWMSLKRPLAYFTATPATTLDELEYLYGVKEWSLDGFNDWVSIKTGHTSADDLEEAKKRALPKDDLADVGSDATEVMPGGAISALAEQLRAAQQRGDIQQAEKIRGEIAREEKRQKGRKWGQTKDVYHIAVSTAEMEQIMRELKMKGKYISRDLWRGGVEFNAHTEALTKDESGSYAKAVKFLRDVEEVYYKYANQNEAVKRSFGPAAHLQAAAKRWQFDVRLDRAIRLAQEALNRGEQPVISVINVSPTEEGAGNVGAALRQINVHKVLMDKKTGEVTDLGEIPEAIAALNDLHERWSDELPASPDPIEKLRVAFGKDKIAVITGNESPKERRRMMDEFQKGIKKVAVISGAGKTGINLHHVLAGEHPAGGLFAAKLDGKDLSATGYDIPGRRHLIEADYEWSATQFKQELGRVDRSGQITPPKVTMVTLGAAAEQKFISTIANRMKTLGAVSKGAAESASSSALEHFELGGDVDNLAVRRSWLEMPKAMKSWFRGSKFGQRGEDGEFYPLQQLTGVGVREFLLQLQLMPVEVGNAAWDLFWDARQKLLTGEAVAAAEARRTARSKGEILRVNELRPDLEMYEVKDAQGHRHALLSGMVSEYMPILRQFLDSHTTHSAEGLPTTQVRREYMSFNAADGRQITGLRLGPSVIERVAKVFDKQVLVKHTPEQALEDLKAGDRLPLETGWSLRMGTGGERKGYIVIEGAKLSNTDKGKLVLRHGAKYNAVSGGFFYLPEDQAVVKEFLERFPLRKEEAGQINPAYSVGHMPGERGWKKSSDVSTLAARYEPVTHGETPVVYIDEVARQVIQPSVAKLDQINPGWEGLHVPTEGIQQVAEDLFDYAQGENQMTASLLEPAPAGRLKPADRAAIFRLAGILNSAALDADAGGVVLVVRTGDPMIEKNVEREELFHAWQARRGYARGVYFGELERTMMGHPATAKARKALMKRGYRGDAHTVVIETMAQIAAFQLDGLNLTPDEAADWFASAMEFMAERHGTEVLSEVEQEKMLHAAAMEVVRFVRRMRDERAGTLAKEVADARQAYALEPGRPDSGRAPDVAQPEKASLDVRQDAKGDAAQGAGGATSDRAQEAGELEDLRARRRDINQHRPTAPTPRLTSKLQNARAQYQEGDGSSPPVLTLNVAARDALLAADKSLESFGGMNMEPATAERIAVALRTLAGSEQHWLAQTRLDQLAETFERAASKAGDGGVVVVVDDGRSDVYARHLTEELTHAIQRQIGAGKIREHIGDYRPLLRDAAGNKMQKYLRANGYGDAPAWLLPAEMGAKIAAFDPGLLSSVTAEEAGSWFDKYLDNIARARGTSAPDALLDGIMQAYRLAEQALARKKSGGSYAGTESGAGSQEAGQGLQRNAEGIAGAGAGGGHPAGNAEARAVEQPAAATEPPALARSTPIDKTSTAVEPFKFEDQDVAAEIEKARGLKPVTTFEKLREGLERIVHMATRKYEDLPRTQEFEPLRFTLTRLEHQRGVTNDKAARHLAKILNDLDKTQYFNFGIKVLLDDLKETADSAMEVPFYTDTEMLARDHEAVTEHVAGDPKVQAALADRRRAWEEIKHGYIGAMEAIGFKVSDRLKRDAYFRHQVLVYANAQEKLLRGSGQKLRTPTGRGFLKHRQGAQLPINTDYLQAEHEVMAQMLFDTEVAKSIKQVHDLYDVSQQLKRDAFKLNEVAVMDYFRELAEVTGDDPVKLFRETLNRKQALAISRLSQMAMKDELPEIIGGRDFSDLLEKLREAFLPTRTEGEQPPDFMGPLLAYANAMLKSSGSPADATLAAKTLFKGIAEKKKFMQDKLGPKYATWSDLIPDGYRVWQPREGSLLYFTKTIPEYVAQELAADAAKEIGISADQLRSVMAKGGRFREYVLPDAVADTLDNLRPPMLPSVVSMITKPAVKAWKLWVLTSPRRLFKYNARNLSGDAEPVFVGNPSAFLKAPEATADLYGYYKNHEISPMLNAWLDRGGTESLLQAQEVGDINQLAMFKRLYESKGTVKGAVVKTWQGYWKAARLTTDFRESVLRYAAFLDYVEQIARNSNGLPDNWGASIPDEVRGLSNTFDKAFKLSNDLLGAYDDLSALGREIREGLAPFWSFQEVNTKRAYRFLRYAGDDPQAKGDGASGWTWGRRVAGGAVRKAPFTAYRIGKLMMKLAGFWALVTAYNYLLFSDEEHELPDEVRARPHMIFGRDKDGNVLYIGRLGAIGDVLDWFGMDKPQRYVRDWLDGSRSASEIAQEMGKKSINKAVSQVAPTIKMPAELLTGSETFPDVFNPRKMRDRGEYLARQFDLLSEYKAVTGRPTRGYLPSLTDIALNRMDKGSASYYDILEQKRRYMEQLGKGGDAGASTSARSDALRNMRMAMHLGDQQAYQKYAQQYFDMGGDVKALRQSLRSMDPLSGLTRAEKMAFVGSLSKDNQKKFAEAYEFYVEYLSPGPQGEEAETETDSSDGSGSPR
jgi:hypothetical protein